MHHGFQIYNVGLYNFLQAPKVAELDHGPPKIGPLRQKLLRKIHKTTISSLHSFRLKIRPFSIRNCCEI